MENKANAPNAPLWVMGALASASMFSFVVSIARILDNPPTSLGFVLLEYWKKFEPTAYVGLTGLVLSIAYISFLANRRCWRIEAIGFLTFFAGLSVTSLKISRLQAALDEAPNEMVGELAGIGIRFALSPFTWSLGGIAILCGVGAIVCHVRSRNRREGE